MENMNSYKVTSIETLREYAHGVVVPLPSFDGSDEPFCVRMKRPSMLALAKSGKIPNALMSTATDLFNNGADAIDEDDAEMLKKIYDMCILMAEASLVEPSYAQLKELGIELTDEQLIVIFNFSQKGVKALKGFRS